MPAPEHFSQGPWSSPAFDGEDVVPNDAADLPDYARALFIGGAGNVKVVTLEDTTLTFRGLNGGAILPVGVKKVYATGTTATYIIALF